MVSLTTKKVGRTKSTFDMEADNVNVFMSSLISI